MDQFVKTPGLQHIARLILEHLDHKTLMSCRRVNQSWKELVDDSNFWLKRCAQSGEKYLKSLQVHN